MWRTFPVSPRRVGTVAAPCRVRGRGRKGESAVHGRRRTSEGPRCGSHARSGCRDGVPLCQTLTNRALCSGTLRAPSRLRGTARRWVVGVSVAATVAISGGHTVFAQRPPGVGQDVCDRTYQVSDAIVTASVATTCRQVTLRHMRDITALDLSDQAISSLRVGDFDGLVRLDTLDQSSNHLTALPQGAFDELLLLKTLRLDNNLLQSVPVYLFDELLLLEELTLHGNLQLRLPNGMFGAFSRFDGMHANADPPDESGSYPKIQRFLDRHSATSPEAFIAALHDVYPQRFAMVYASESPAQPHVSGSFPRIVFWEETDGSPLRGTRTLQRRPHSATWSSSSGRAMTSGRPVSSTSPGERHRSRSPVRARCATAP